MLSPEDMQRIVGPGAYDQHGKGNVNVGDGGVAFLLASAGTIPGGAPLVSPQAFLSLCFQCRVSELKQVFGDWKESKHLPNAFLLSPGGSEFRFPA